MASIRLARRPIGRETFAGIARANCNVNACRIFCANIYIYKAEVSVKRKVFPFSVPTLPSIDRSILGGRRSRA